MNLFMVFSVDGPPSFSILSARTSRLANRAARNTTPGCGECLLKTVTISLAISSDFASISSLFFTIVSLFLVLPFLFFTFFLLLFFQFSVYRLQAFLDAASFSLLQGYIRAHLYHSLHGADERLP